MNKVKKLFNKLAISFALLGMITTGAFFASMPTNVVGVANAEVTQHQKVENDLPDYVNIALDDSSQMAKVDDTIYLFTNDNSFKDIIIGNDVITSNANSDNKNYGYYPEETNTLAYYYFDFQSSLSLYHNLSNKDIQNGASGENLLKNQAIDNFTTEHDSPFVPTGYSFTPQKFDLKLKLNTTETSLKIDGNTVTLNQEGCYTLVIPVSIYMTDNDGITFKLAEKTINYTFMVFNANTYFDNLTGKPNISPSPNMQESMLNASSNYSAYYFYNYSYAQSINTLPTISYNPEKFQLTITYTNLDQETFTFVVEYSDNTLKHLDVEGNEIPESKQIVNTTLTNKTELEKTATIIFTELGSYDFSINYLYVAKADNSQTTYHLPFERLKGSTAEDLIFKNKAQRLYVYGYQAVYSDYSSLNSDTNQPLSKELKTFDFETNTYAQSADITSAVNNYILNNSAVNEDKENAGMQNPSKDSLYNLNTLKGYAQTYINLENIKPVSTNQTPIKFITNTKLNSEVSKIYKVTESGDPASKTLFDDNTKFQGFNQNNAGTYLYIIQYKFDSFMSTSGTLQSGFYHYQIFYFTVTNTTPTVTVYDDCFSEIYTGGYTNKSVYVLNDAENNVFDAKVKITLSAQDYTSKKYFFEPTNIEELSQYGMYYSQFEKAEDIEEYRTYNSLVAGKYGILIENTNKYANALFTVEITSANSEKPSKRTFTIDTNPIEEITARGVSVSSSTTYRIGEKINNYATNNSFVLSWKEKASNATTYGYVKHIPLTSINYYSSLNEDKLAALISRLISHDTLPVSYKLDVANASAWTEYSNSVDFANTIQSTYVKSNDGIYILEVYDQAGNSAFSIFMKDSTSPIFIEEIVGDTTVRKLISNSDSISVPDKGIDISIKWTANKAIYIENINSYTTFEAYKYGIDKESADEKLAKTLDNFFNIQKNSNLKFINDIEVETTPDTDPNYAPTGINSYKGTYLIIPINSKVYIKDAQSSNFKAYETTSYQITFLDKNDNAIEGTYKILIQDASNSFNKAFATEDTLATNYKQHPSGHLSFNVTSDASKLMVNFKNGESLDYASYNMSGNLYKYEDEDSKIHYTHLSDKGTDDDEFEYEETNLSYKFLYHTPIKANKELVLSYIPVAENGSKLNSIVLNYYPFVLDCEEYRYTTIIDGRDVEQTKYYYYYKISETPTRTVNVFTLSNKTYDQGQIETFAIELGSDSLPLAGRYVIERTYIDGNETDKYDYFKRTITFLVDDFSLISQPEKITTPDNTASSLESVVGGDIVLSMYSGEGLSSLEVSFPSYTADGLSKGSFYTSTSFNEGENLKVFAVAGNKLPMSLFIPQNKFTVSSKSEVKNDQTAYSVSSNKDLSYYGNAYWIQNDDTGMFDVYVEGVVVDSFLTSDLAQEYIDNNISIEEYKIKAEIKASVFEKGKEVTKYYYSNGEESNGYLKFYPGDEDGNILPESLPVDYFYLKGKYVVTIYQASNIGTTSNFYSLYKFGFEIISQEPDFVVYGSDGYELSRIENMPNILYTNSDLLTVEWQVPTSPYQAKIDENSIQIKSYPSTSPAIRSDIQSGTNVRYLTLDTSRLIVTENSFITITMQYEGYNKGSNSNHYNPITKTIYFDRSAPTQNLTGLMTLTESATNSAFPVNYQQYFMRRYFDYKNQEITPSADADLVNMSYSYSVDNGYFKYYSYNVTKEFFHITLKQTLSIANTLPYDTQYIYYKHIENFNSYTQVEKSSFSTNNYRWIDIEESGNPEIVCGYYEVVELDYAGNMTVYVVYVVDSTLEEDDSVRTDALTYINNIHDTPKTITNDQISQGFNIYSNSGFELTDFNYKSDPWAIFNITLAGQTTARYMKSPWLEENYIYKISFTASGISFEEVKLSKVFEDIDSSSNKHQLVFTDRITGTNALVYLSIMDASLNTQKIEDPNKSSAILNISIPTRAQYESTSTSYAFPTRITIKQFDQDAEPDKWKTIIIANQISYGEWIAETTPIDYSNALEYISFNVVGTSLQIVINLGEHASQKIMYEIEDNFGNVATVIQLANEVSYNEVEGNNNVYKFVENDNSTTYVSSETIRYSFNVLLYDVKIFDKNGNNITADMQAFRKDNAATNISVYSFNPTSKNIYDDYYKIEVRDIENPDEPNPKVIHLRIVYNLPYITFVPNEVHGGGIIFNDKNQQPIDEKDINSISSITVTYNGIPYTSSGYSISSYNNVTLRFKNGQDYEYEGSFEYQKGYTYSTYLSRDNGLTWENINSQTSAISGYTISGVGEYLVLIKYDDEIFENLCKIFTVSIIDQDKFPLYSIRVDNMTVEKSDIKFTSRNNVEYEINYVVSVDWADKDNRLTLIANEEKGVVLSIIDSYSTESNVHVEIYHYESNSNIVGDFTILYIEETSNFVSTFTYDTPAGTTVPLKDTTYAMIAANKETENNFNQLKLNFTSYYGIKENKIRPKVLKLFNGSYVEIECKLFEEGEYSYIYLERAGSYRIKLYDSCTPANIQAFKGSEYIDIVFLSSVPFIVSHTENEQVVTTEPIQKAIYNSSVTIELTNLYTDSYYQPSGYPAISVQRNGKDYKGFAVDNRKFIFTEPGFYSVKFSATSKTGVQLREEVLNFSIIMKNELRYSYEISQFNKYYIEKVEKDGVDITNALVEFGNFKTISIEGQPYLSALSLAHSLLDEKTGDGRYTITINPNSSGYSNVIGENFTFELRIGYVSNLPINVSIAEGASTSKKITVSYNVLNLYNTVGDCVVKVAGIERKLTGETLADYDEVDIITITGAGTHYIQVYTLSGRPVYSYKVTKTEPLNIFAIIAIIVGVIAIVAIVVITVKIRKRQRVK